MARHGELDAALEEPGASAAEELQELAEVRLDEAPRVVLSLLGAAGAREQ